MIIREHYLQQVRPFYDSDLIKIITGIRRSGKSVVLQQIVAELQNKSDNCIILNFEDEEVLEKIPDGKALLEYVSQNRKAGKCYILLDEIQEIENWQKACKTLRLKDNSVFITGSNSKLLSSEFAKELSGRYVAFRIRPFVYSELQEYARELNREISTMDYLIWGGFPKRVEFEQHEAMVRYLENLNETIVINDLITRYKIRKKDLFRRLVTFILRSNSRIFSCKSITNYLNSNQSQCSFNTVVKYLDCLEEAYIINRVRQYSKKTKKELEFYVKLYNEDVSLNSIKVRDKRYDLTHNLENIVYNELVYRGYELHVYVNGGKEIDFRASKNGKTYFVQVAYSLVEEKTYQREFDAFNGIDNLSQKIIISCDEIDYSNSIVRHIKFKDFLLMNDF